MAPYGSEIKTWPSGQIMATPMITQWLSRALCNLLGLRRGRSSRRSRRDRVSLRRESKRTAAKPAVVREPDDASLSTAPISVQIDGGAGLRLRQPIARARFSSPRSAGPAPRERRICRPRTIARRRERSNRSGIGPGPSVCGSTASRRWRKSTSRSHGRSSAGGSRSRRNSARLRARVASAMARAGSEARTKGSTSTAYPMCRLCRAAHQRLRRAIRDYWRLSCGLGIPSSAQCQEFSRRSCAGVGHRAASLIAHFAMAFSGVKAERDRLAAELVDIYSALAQKLAEFLHSLLHLRGPRLPWAIARP
jgi:hypothetical protein